MIKGDFIMNDEDTKIVNEETENLKNEGSKNSADVTPIVAVYREFKIWLKRLSDKTQERLIITFLIIAYLFGIGSHILVGVKRSKYKALLADNAALNEKIAQGDNSYKALQDEYNAYKSKMQPYENIQLTDAQNKAEQESRALAEKKAAEEKAAAEAKAKKEAEEKAAAEKKAAEERAAAAAKAAEEAKGYETGITFDNLARTPDAYIGKKVKFSGKVIQVLEGSAETQIRLAVSGNYDKIIFCRVPKSKTTTNRILENDYIHIMGVSNGLVSYQSTLGSTITIPDISVDDWGQN